MPGATRTFHMYDINLLLALEHSVEKGEMAIVTYNPDDRKLSVGPGVLASIVSITNSSRINRRGESSESKLVMLRALRPIRVASVAQYEPFVVAKVEDIMPGASSRLRETQEASIVALCKTVISLREDLSLPLLPATSDGASDTTRADFAHVTGGSELAWLAAQHCLPEMRAAALKLQGGSLGDYVIGSLVNTRAKLIAMKSLTGLSEKY